MAEVKLHGFWPSPFSHRVIWALKLKGIDYEYIEEDIFSDKSELLLEYNPVYKKIPVLVHGDKPIAESIVILEYIEETWPEINPLLPEDPYERAMARFWIQYGETKGFAALATIFGASKEDEQKAALDVLKTLEDQCLGDKKFFGGDTINLVDISFGVFAWWLPIIEEIVGVKMVEPSTLPRLHAWAKNFTQLPVIKENLVDHDKLLAHMRWVRERVAKN